MTFFRCLVAMTGLVILLPSAQSVEIERMRIEKNRQQLQAGFVVEDAACRRKFAVNNCLNEINAKHREAMTDLRRQEISLNDDERKKRGAEQVRRVEEKLSAVNRQQFIDRRAQIFTEYEVGADRERSAQKSRAEQAQGENKPSGTPVNKKTWNKKSSMNGRLPADAETVGGNFDRQNKTREKRIKRRAVAFEQSTSNAKPLPVPP